MAYDLDVLLPFHKENYFLNRAIASLAQSQAINFNVLLIDDRSDPTKDLTGLFSQLSSFQVIKTAGGTGYGNALKIGSQAISSNAVALFNSDDEMHPQRFNKQLRMLDQYSLSFTKMQRMTSQGQPDKSLAGDLSGNKFDPAYLMLGSYGANATWCMRTEWWIKNAFFDIHEALDWRIALRSFNRSSVGYINENLYFYRKHKGQNTVNKDLSQEALTPLYNEWRNFSKNLDLGDFTYDTFMLLGAPWNKVADIKFSDFFEAAQKIEAYTANLEQSIQKDFYRLLRRRYIFALRNKTNMSTRSRLLLKGLLEVPSLIRDFTF
jgi:hypothetical protein